MDREKINREYQTILLLRWVLIVATGYLLLFHQRSGPVSPTIALFVAGYLCSNLLVAALLRRIRARRRLEMGIALFDAAAVSAALLSAKNFASDFFLLYFVVLFLAAQTERLALVVVTAAVISVLHIYATVHISSAADLLQSGVLLRVPFLFVVALFFGNLVERVRAAEHEAAAARENEKIITDFVAEVVHALKTPVGATQALAEILLEPQTGPLTLDQSELLRRIRANAQHLTRMTANLLEAPHLEKSALRLQRQPADLRRVVEDVLSVVRTTCDVKGVSLELEAPASLPHIEVDADQIDRAVWNLLDNAIRSAPAGGEVFVSIDHTAQGIALGVYDDGPGVAADDMSTLFDRFRREDDGRVSSTGFGLFVAKAIVEAHGGTIEVDSEIGGGTTFTVHLPIQRTASASNEQLG